MSVTKIEAIGIHDYDKYPEAKKFVYEPQALRPQDVDIKIDACGICGSDIHAACGNWGKPYAPVAVGHEIIGTIVAVGKDVQDLKIGDRVGVGAQADSCGKCYRCNHQHENNCDNGVATYFGTYKETGFHSQGGYASHVRLSNKFAVKIPDGLSSEHAAPLLCGGITGFKPLLDAGVKEGTKVGVVGIGGIGQMTILFAKALGAEVTAISRTDSKKEVALKLGADHYIATNEEGFESKYADTLEVIVNTGSNISTEGVKPLIRLLRPQGTLTIITAPPAGTQLEVNPGTLLHNNIKIGGSTIGAPHEIAYMLKLAAEKNIAPWIEKIPISEENVTKAWSRMDSGDVRFRFVLTDFDKCFGSA